MNKTLDNLFTNLQDVEIFSFAKAYGNRYIYIVMNWIMKYDIMHFRKITFFIRFEVKLYLMDFLYYVKNVETKSNKVLVRNII